MTARALAQRMNGEQRRDLTDAVRKCIAADNIPKYGNRWFVAQEILHLTIG